MSNIFNSIKLTRPNKNVFDLSHDVKFSANMGELTPTLCMECVPGDKFNISCESLLRFAPLVAPVMHRMDVTMHYFFVPNRILWPSWEKFITNTVDPLTQDLPAFPTININMDGSNYTRLLDYMGVPYAPVGATSLEAISALPFAAYQKIYSEYYRDQNLMAETFEPLIDGDNTPPVPTVGLMALHQRCWEHDYFTAALPFAQKGAGVNLPLGGFNDVNVYLNDDPQGDATVLDGTPSDVTVEKNPDAVVGVINPGGLYAQTSELDAGSTTINDLRRAFRLQEWLEKAARGGSRYIESILSHFGVKSSDKRLQRPEYITGTKSPVVISEVLNTSDTPDNPQGNMAGHGVSVTGGKYGSYYCEEHGYIIGIMSVLPKTAYQQGLAKHFLKTTPFDFYWPSFANIGEQPILNKELYAFTSAGNDTFGYVPRYSEYKYQPSRVAGEFRDSLDFWHLGRIFEGAPALNDVFVAANPTERVFAVTDAGTEKLYCHVLHKIKAVRPMPKYGTPTY